ncbi:MAG: NUDIX hydrolase [Patescibacteria group bacterium]|nr:NUDIX hydrolase [Patescibacteria group bacterium]
MDVVIIFIKNSKGEFFLHKRSVRKFAAPGFLGVGAGGKVKIGEKVDEGAKRELFEETGIAKTPKKLFTLTWGLWPILYNVHFYELTYNGKIPNSQEWEWSKWVKKSELLELLDKHAFYFDTTEGLKKYFNH